mmetsp:Transcript_7845/g.19466  ORF Transcript_7845/g.19466 Transcript_7845/m.19466 type:complete len:335 (+) Transcript_7845:85-1089(+)|eukprot:CAMPEP_0184722318 /NCGR_PEP_ID=MMETSP0314-20130426/21750_1 /TAXON_ID=38298 /ORGANISM="Rhodella maculata, Strain CCMP 736" /LENGTH=334 /DNA_ID=CAMNT_0027186889 /DNA_START=44 /DNA_END=1048 /DNA_ORIENTATION=+
MSETKGGELLVLILSNGMAYSDLVAVIEARKASSKSIGTHARRQLYWTAYSKLISKIQALDGSAHCFLKFTSDSSSDGDVEIVELTKRQRGLVGGGCDFMGQKLKSPEDPTAKGWCMVFSEADAKRAWDDLMDGEPCIYLTTEGVYVGTRFKRALCKSLSGPLKTLKDVEAAVAGLEPDNPLKSVSFVANDPPAVNSYNLFLVGPSTLGPALPPTIGHVVSGSTADIYDYFLKRKMAHQITEAEKLIGLMLKDIAKEQVPLVSTGKKEASIAVKNSLMKRVFVHESMVKFIDYVKKDNAVELCVIAGPIENTLFGQYGGLVFELFYRADLSSFG